MSHALANNFCDALGTRHICLAVPATFRDHPHLRNPITLLIWPQVHPTVHILITWGYSKITLLFHFLFGLECIHEYDGCTCVCFLFNLFSFWSELKRQKYAKHIYIYNIVSMRFAANFLRPSGIKGSGACVACDNYAILSYSVLYYWGLIPYSYGLSRRF